MDTFAALALATDPPTPNILNRKPEPRSAPLISLTMWKMIVGQSIYQLVVTVVLYFAGSTILKYLGPGELQTLIFNTFVWMQIFNQYNCRRIDNGFNIFEGVMRNYFFVGIQVIIVGGQLLIIFVGGDAFAIHPLSGYSWAISVVLGFLSVPVAILIRLIPDKSVSKCIPKNVIRKKPSPQLVVSYEEQYYAYNPALEDIKEELAFLKMVRGGRLNLLKYRLSHPSEIFHPRSRSGSRSRNSSAPQTPTGERTSEQWSNSPGPPTPESRRSMQRQRTRSRSNSAFGPAAAMAGMIAGSIGGSFSPIGQRDADGNTVFQGTLNSRAELEARIGIGVHPDTNPSDPVISDPSENRHLRPPSNSFASSLAPPSREHSENASHFGQQLAPPQQTSHRGPSRSHKPHASA